MTLNCRSLRNKTSDLKVLLEDYKLDVGALQETWLNKGDKSIYAEIKEKGYKVYKRERAEGKGGGLAILINTLTCIKSSAVYNYKYSTFENVVCSVTISKVKQVIINIYRPPSQSQSKFLIDFEDFITKIHERYDLLIFFGDFNIDFISNTKTLINLKSLLSKYNLTQIVEAPTRLSTLLDYVVINSSLLDTSCIISNSLASFPSDHKPVLLRVRLKHPKITTNNKIPIEIRNYNVLDVDELRSNLLKSDLVNLELINTMNSNECINLYNTAMTKIFDSLCPKKKRLARKDKTKKWFNKNLGELKRKKRQAERAYRKSPGSLDCFNYYKKVKNDYTKLLKDTRVKFYAEKLQKYKDDTKNLHKVLKELTGNKKEQISHTKYSENETANKLATFYTNKVLNIRNTISASAKTEVVKIYNTSKHTQIEIDGFSSFEKVDPETLKKTLLSMKKKHCSLDPGPTTVIMKCLDLLLPIFLRIINDAISNSIFPDPLKNSTVTPVAKDPSGDPDDFTNLRPINSIPFLAKALEKIMHGQLNKYFELNKLYPNYQSSYREHHSCETALICMTDEIQKSVHEGKNVILLILDNSAAFDTVDQDILLEKLENSYYVKGKALNMISSYFKNRTFSVKINNHTSTPTKLRFGVPQGSLLGPLFYIAYTKLIELIVHSHGLKIQSYADDCQIYAPFQDNEHLLIENKIQECMKDIQSFMRNNFLKLNNNKTKIKLFKHKNSLIIESNTLGEISQGPVKILGAHFNNIFKFNEFVSHKIKICNFNLRNLYNIRSSLDIKTRILLITNLIFTTIDYCNILLLGSTDKQLRPLKLMINKTARFIYNVKFTDHITPYLKLAHFLPIRHRIKFKACMIGYKICNGQAPQYLCQKFQMFVRTTERELREGFGGRDKFMFSSESWELRSRVLSSQIKNEWNALPVNIRKCKTLETFKTKLKTHFFEDAYP